MKHIRLSLLVLFVTLALSGCDFSNRQHGELMGGIGSSQVADNSEETSDRNSSDVNNDANDDSKQQVAAPKGVEIPAPLKDRDEQILVRKAYTVSYNKSMKIPNWVAWHLTSNHTSGPFKRGGIKFHEDDEVPFPKAMDTDYRRSGYDRGHLCPSGDNKWDGQAQEESFLFTNICPQVHGLNAGDWNEIEMQTRKWAEEFGDIYIVSGPILYKGKHKTIGSDKVVVPEAFFKVILCLRGKPKGIGFIYKNTGGNRPKGDYVNSIHQIERITGINFFPSLPDNVEKEVESQNNIDDWY
jgi:endonuclease G